MMKNFFYESFDALTVNKNKKNKYSTKITKTTIDEISKKEVIIKVLYSSLNYKDSLVCSGNKALVRKYPHIPGIDAAGIINKTFSKKFKTGDKVVIIAQPLGIKSSGGFARYVKAPNNWVKKIPKGMSLKNSMIFGTAGFTAALAVNALVKNGLNKKFPVLVSGATGGVGILAIYLLSRLGFSVCAITRKKAQTKLLKRIGATDVIHTKEFENYAEMPLLKIKFSGIIDNVGSNIITTGIKQIINNGQLISIGNVSSDIFEINIMPLILRGIKIIGINAETANKNLRKAAWKTIVKYANDKKLKLIYKEYNLKNIFAPLGKIKKGTHVGRAIINLKK